MIGRNSNVRKLYINNKKYLVQLDKNNAVCDVLLVNNPELRLDLLNEFRGRPYYLAKKGLYEKLNESNQES